MRMGLVAALLPVLGFCRAAGGDATAATASATAASVAAASSVGTPP